MSDVKTFLIGLVVMAAVAGTLLLLFRGLASVFSREARDRRRRARSHGRVVSRVHGPWVKLAVKTEKRKDDQ